MRLLRSPLFEIALGVAGILAALPLLLVGARDPQPRVALDAIVSPTVEATYEPPVHLLRELRVFATPAPTEASQPSPTPEPGPTVAVEDPRVGQLRAFYGSRSLGAYAASMIAAADGYGIDWRLMPVISILESSGGLQACGGNAWGYAACRVRFGSFEEGIQVVAGALARSPYAGRSTAAILCIWVSGKACTDGHGVDYAYRAFSLYTSLGGWFALPPRPSTQSVTVVEQPTPTPAPTSTPAPTEEPSPTAAPEPSATPTDQPTTAPEPTATPEATSSPEATGTSAAMEGQPTP